MTAKKSLQGGLIVNLSSAELASTLRLLSRFLASKPDTSENTIMPFFPTTSAARKTRSRRRTWTKSKSGDVPLKLVST